MATQDVHQKKKQFEYQFRTFSKVILEHFNDEENTSDANYTF